MQNTTIIRPTTDSIDDCVDKTTDSIDDCVDKTTDSIDDCFDKKKGGITMVVGSNSIICWNNVKTFLIYQCYVSKLAGVHTSIIDEYFCLNVSLVNSV